MEQDQQPREPTGDTGLGPAPATVAAVLAIRPGGLGEVVRAIPALRHLRDAYPAARLSVAAASGARELLDACPFVDRVIELERPSEALLERFDVAVSFARPGAGGDALAVDAVDAACRVAWSGPNDRRVPARPAWPERLDSSSRMLRLAWLVDGALHPDPTGGLWTRLSDRNGAARLVRDVSRPVAVVHVGSGEAGRRWPSDRWVPVVDAIDAAGLDVVLVGTREDMEWAEPVASCAASPPLMLVGLTSVGQLVGLLERAALFVGTDSGPAALAGAVGVRSVVVGPASPFEHAPRPGVVDLIAPAGAPATANLRDLPDADEVPLEAVLGRVQLAATTARDRWDRQHLR